mmetsp:Transcript_24643/g.56895  ORF Transcript_24643/g.56895 Transcript_24643/m.56895 type:complete len:255 (-) Transcript_24643:364-1128(-)
MPARMTQCMPTPYSMAAHRRGRPILCRRSLLKKVIQPRKLRVLKSPTLLVLLLQLADHLVRGQLRQGQAQASQLTSLEGNRAHLCRRRTSPGRCQVLASLRASWATSQLEHRQRTLLRNTLLLWGSRAHPAHRYRLHTNLDRLLEVLVCLTASLALSLLRTAPLLRRHRLPRGQPLRVFSCLHRLEVILCDPVGHSQSSRALACSESWKRSPLDIQKLANLLLLFLLKQHKLACCQLALSAATCHHLMEVSWPW